MQENSKLREWQNQTELDSVKVVIIARNEANQLQADDFVTSAPLEKPKPVGDWMNYTALFPLKGNTSPTKMVLPGLIQRDHSNNEYSTHGQYKRESIELLITLVFGNEAITLGKSRLLVTGEELRTKQSDVPIDITRDGILHSQKKSHFPMKRTTHLPKGKEGEISPIAFKYDRRRRKFQIETDAVLRVFFKVSPHNPHNNTQSSIPNIDTNASMMRGEKNGGVFARKKLFGNGPVRSSRERGVSPGPRNRSNSIGPGPRNRGMSGGGQIGIEGSMLNGMGGAPGPVEFPNTVGGYGDSSSRRRMGPPSGPNGSPYQPVSTGRPPSSHSNGHYSAPPSVIGGSTRGLQQNMNMQSMHSIQGGMSSRSPPSPRVMNSQGSYYSNNSGRSGPPSGPTGMNQSMNQRSQSVPRMRHGSGGGDQSNAYGGSSFGYGGGGNANMSRNSGPKNMSRGRPTGNGGGQQQYGGSTFGGSPRKMNYDQGSSNGYGNQGGHGGGRGGGSRGRSQSPYITRNF